MFVVGGESLIDLISEPTGADGTIRLVAHQGGSPYNCAIALSTLGNRTGFLCPISSDGLGTYLLGPLAAAGVTPLLAERVDAYTTLAVVTFDAKKSAQYGFYRNADRAFSTDKLIAALPDAIAAFQVGGFCPIEPEDAAAWMAVVVEAKRRGAVLSMDPNVRPSLVPDFAGYKTRLSAFLDEVHVVKVSIEDLASLEQSRAVRATELGAGEVEALIQKYVADFLGRRHLELVIVTLGEEGSRAFTRSGAASAAIYSPPVFGDTVGAGDTLMAAVLTWLQENGALSAGRLAALDDAALAQMLRFGAVAAGLNCGEVGCHPPTRDKVDAILAA
jgi:fructokinase